MIKVEIITRMIHVSILGLQICASSFLRQHNQTPQPKLSSHSILLRVKKMDGLFRRTVHCSLLRPRIDEFFPTLLDSILILLPPRLVYGHVGHLHLLDVLPNAILLVLPNAILLVVEAGDSVDGGLVIIIPRFPFQWH